MATSLPDQYRASWEALLFYKDAWGRRQSSIDNQNFFLAQDGRINSSSEWESTIVAFKQNSAEARCKFPARFHFIKSLYPDLFQGDVECQNFEEFKQKSFPKELYLVFASYYLNNPASMFGHTFLRLRGPKSLSAYNDLAIEFSADPTTSNPVVYAYLGLTGGFYGNFRLKPYYAKIQEYNDFESRALWEYKIDLNQEQKELLVRVMYEILPHQTRYYYLDDNCSFLILQMITAATGDTSVLNEFPLFSAPSDTVKSLCQKDLCPGPPIYRPSARFKYEATYDLISKEERKLFMKTIESNTIPKELSTQTVTSQALIYDTILEYIRYDEKLVGPAEPTERLNLFRESLIKRAQLGIISEHIEYNEQGKSPLDGGRLSRIGIFYENYQGQHLGKINFMGGLHKFSDPIAGYPIGMQFRLLDLGLRIEPSAIDLEDIQWFQTVSGNLPYLWSLSVSTKRRYLDGYQTDEYRLDSNFSGGGGFSFSGSQWLVYASVNTGASVEASGKFYPIAITEGGIYYYPINHFTIGLEAKRHFKHHETSSLVVKLPLSYDFKSGWGGRVNITHKNKQSSFSIGGLQYF